MRLILFVVSLLVSPAALAGAELAPVWVAAGCYAGAIAPSRPQALARCRQIDHQMRHEHHGHGCDCAQSQFILMRADDAPVYVIDSCSQQTGDSEQAAVAACRKLQSEKPTQASCQCGANLVRVFGPFVRHPVAPLDKADDVKRFSYLGSDGEWYDEKGVLPCSAGAGSGRSCGDTAAR